MREGSDRWARKMMERYRGPRRFVVLKKNQYEPWVQQAIARGDQVEIVSIPWWLRLWWWLKQTVLRRKLDEGGQANSAARPTDAPSLPGVRPDRDGGREEDGGDLL